MSAEPCTTCERLLADLRAAWNRRSREEERAVRQRMANHIREVHK